MNLTAESHITQLENRLETALAARPESLEALAAQKSEAEKLLAQFVANPISENLDKLRKAQGELTAAENILKAVGDTTTWPTRIRSSWVSANFPELCDLLQRVITERSGRRQAYRDAAGIEMGRLTTAIVRADGNNASEGELKRLNDQLAAIEDDLANKEGRLNLANEALKLFKLSNGLDAGPSSFHGSIFDQWTNAKGAALSVDFEPAAWTPPLVTKHATPARITRATSLRTDIGEDNRTD